MTMTDEWEPVNMLFWRDFGSWEQSFKDVAIHGQLVGNYQDLTPCRHVVSCSLPHQLHGIQQRRRAVRAALSEYLEDQLGSGALTTGAPRFPSRDDRLPSADPQALGEVIL
jgi:hypothetical protein